jgi:hypothetical protein
VAAAVRTLSKRRDDVVRIDRMTMVAEMAQSRKAQLAKRTEPNVTKRTEPNSPAARMLFKPSQAL